MTDQERLEKAKEEYHEWVEMHDGMVPSEDLKEFEEDANQRWWLIEQAKEKKQLEELVKELEKERSQWKGKHSVLKRKYKGLQKKMNNRWRYNRAVENESKTNRTVLEKFREENQGYKQALESVYSIIQLAHLDEISNEQALKQIENLVIDSWESEGEA